MRIRKGKLLVALGLCMALMFALCACGSTVNDKETTSTTAESSVQNAETEKAENPETDITQGTEAATRQNGTDTAETDATANQPEETEQYNSVLVVYFSHTGTTKGVSEYLHGLVGDRAAQTLSVHGMTPSDMIALLPKVLSEFE